MAVNTLIQMRRGLAATWTSVNPILAPGELGLETDTLKIKAGNGATAWNSLGYIATDGDITAVVAGTGLTGGATSGSATVSLDTTSVYVVPSQTGNSGKYLTTNGSVSSWATVDALPSQTGNSGKYLTTNGTSASWATIVTDPTPSVFMLMGA